MIPGARIVVFGDGGAKYADPLFCVEHQGVDVAGVLYLGRQAMADARDTGVEKSLRDKHPKLVVSIIEDDVEFPEDMGYVMTFPTNVETSALVRSLRQAIEAASTDLLLKQTSFEKTTNIPERGSTSAAVPIIVVGDSSKAFVEDLHTASHYKMFSYKIGDVANRHVIFDGKLEWQNTGPLFLDGSEIKRGGAQEWICAMRKASPPCIISKSLCGVLRFSGADVSELETELKAASYRVFFTEISDQERATTNVTRLIEAVHGSIELSCS